MVMAFVLLAVLFVCGLVNSLFYLPPKKLLAWIQALIPIAKPSLITSPATTPTTTTSSDKAELRNVFATFDKNSDGIITEEELRESLKNIGFSITDTDLVHMVEKLDSNRDGLIDLEEFSKLYESVGISRSKQRGGRDRELLDCREEEEVDEERDLKEAFDVFDGNRDGLITVEELSLVLSSLGLKQGLRSEDCREMIKSVDMDGDGMVNFEEFKKMMMKAGGSCVGIS